MFLSFFARYKSNINSFLCLLVLLNLLFLQFHKLSMWHDGKRGISLCVSKTKSISVNIEKRPFCKQLYKNLWGSTTNKNGTNILVIHFLRLIQIDFLPGYILYIFFSLASQGFHIFHCFGFDLCLSFFHSFLSERHIPSLCHWSESSGTSSPGWCSHSPKCPGNTKQKTTINNVLQTQNKNTRACRQEGFSFGTKSRTTFSPDTGQYIIVRPQGQTLFPAGRLLESGSSFDIQPHHISFSYLPFAQKSLLSVSDEDHGWVSYCFQLVHLKRPLACGELWVLANNKFI